MFRAENSFVVLVAQIERGDLSAQVQLRRKLEPEIIHIVRRTLQDGRDRTRLDRRILAEARRFGLDRVVAPEAERERLIRELADSVCTSVISKLQPSDDCPAEETVGDTVVPSL